MASPRADGAEGGPRAHHGPRPAHCGGGHRWAAARTGAHAGYLGLPAGGFRGGTRRAAPHRRARAGAVTPPDCSSFGGELSAFPHTQAACATRSALPGEGGLLLLWVGACLRVQVETLAHFGVVFLLFVLGIEFSAAKVKAVKAVAVGGGTLIIAGSMLAGMGVALLLSAPLTQVRSPLRRMLLRPGVGCDGGTDGRVRVGKHGPSERRVLPRGAPMPLQNWEDVAG
jgi:hypothetical protein